jgi:hypothetical protein
MTNRLCKQQSGASVSVYNHSNSQNTMERILEVNSMLKPYALAALVSVFAGLSVAADRQDTVKVETVIPIRTRQFDLAQVKLLDGPFKQAMDRNARWLLELEADRLLAWFRKEAGLEPKAPVYGGWESRGVAGQGMGHYLSALSLHYKTTKDSRFRTNNMLERIMREIRRRTRVVGNFPDGNSALMLAAPGCGILSEPSGERSGT